MEGSLEAEDALAAGDRPQPGLAGREHGQIQPRHGQASDRLGGEDPQVVAGGAPDVGARPVGAGQDQPREDQRVAATRAHPLGAGGGEELGVGPQHRGHRGIGEEAVGGDVGPSGARQLAEHLGGARLGALEADGRA